MERLLSVSCSTHRDIDINMLLTGLFYFFVLLMWKSIANT